MKVLHANGGELTNFEVLAFLKSRGATADPMGCLGGAAPSECKVFEYIAQTAACFQSKEAINEFVTRCEKFKLTKAEKLKIINLRPTSEPEMFAVIDNCDVRLKGENEVQELLDLVEEVFLPPPAKPEAEAEDEEAVEELGDQDMVPEEETGDQETLPA